MSNKIIKINRGDSYEFIVNIPDNTSVADESVGGSWSFVDILQANSLYS